MSEWWKPSLRRVLALSAFSLLIAFVVAGVAGAGLFKARMTSRSEKVDFQKEIQPLLKEYCYECHNDTKHKGGLSLQAYTNVAAIRQSRATWAELLRKVRTNEMPPENKPQPAKKERDRLATWIDAELFPVDCENPDPGRVTIRRLNRAEYNNTIRDLLGIDFHPAEDFPNDDTGYGFDNIGDVLTLSPLLLEKYLAAAEKIIDATVTNAATRSRIFTSTPTAQTTNDCITRIIGNFARKAFRRPVTPAEIERLAGLATASLANGETFENSIKLTFEAVLISPHFLFRGEFQPSPDNPKNTHAIDEFALASRLSYFLWSSMPDDQLFALAEKGRLRKELPKQIQRMLTDPKSAALIQNFAGQWLQLRNLKAVAPDGQVFPAFDEDLRSAMAKETELFFANIVHEDRSVLEFLTADYSFVNERLARHYGLKQKLAGSDFQKVSLKGTGRAGVLTHGSVLTVTSNPTRTSPVKRGKWVLENLLAQPPPPPLPNVPPLTEDKEAAAAASLRQRMEKHREDPLCASCHAQMDPIGFSMENFDGIGAWRDADGAFPIDSSGQLPGGDHFTGVNGLKEILASRRKEQFLKCISEKMLTYALGRGLEYYDRCALDKIVSQLGRKDCRFSALIEAVVNSVPFQMRRGEGERLSSAAN